MHRSFSSQQQQKVLTYEYFFHLNNFTKWCADWITSGACIFSDNFLMIIVAQSSYNVARYFFLQLAMVCVLLHSISSFFLLLKFNIICIVDLLLQLVPCHSQWTTWLVWRHHYKSLFFLASLIHVDIISTKVAYIC